MIFLKRLVKPSPRQTGSILIYVLWLSALLGMFTLSIGFGVRQKLKMVDRVESRRSLRLAAESGVQRALWTIQQPLSDDLKADYQGSVWSQHDLLFKEINLGRSRFSVVKPTSSDSTKEVLQFGLVDEDRKINVNTLQDAAILKRLALLVAGTTESEASIIADSILDWIDPDDHVNASGAETRYYRSLKRPLAPKNNSIDALEELLYVRGMNSSIFKKMRPYLTIYGEAKVNINTASRAVLLALGMDPESLSMLLSFRDGVDQKPGTADDGILYSPADVLAVADSTGTLSLQARSALEQFVNSGYLKTTSEYFEAVVEASRKSGLEILTAKAILSRHDGIQSWSEVNTRRA